MVHQKKKRERTKNKGKWYPILPSGLAPLLQELLQAGEVVPAHSAGRVLPLSQDLGSDQLSCSLFALLQVAQHVTCTTHWC